MDPTDDNIAIFNDVLVDNGVDITILKYIEYLRNTFYPDVEAEFAHKLIGLIERNEICIDQTMLVHTGVLKSTRSNSIKTICKQYSLVVDVDYRCDIYNDHTTGWQDKVNYVFHPRAFHVILMRSKNQKKYSNYYSLFFECSKHYKRYRYQLNATA